MCIITVFALLLTLEVCRLLYQYFVDESGLSPQSSVLKDARILRFVTSWKKSSSSQTLVFVYFVLYTYFCKLLATHLNFVGDECTAFRWLHLHSRRVKNNYKNDNNCWIRLVSARRDLRGTTVGSSNVSEQERTFSKSTQDWKWDRRKRPKCYSFSNTQTNAEDRTSHPK